ncbi:hypothetical protein ABK040_013463 [Willaertia magna]
MSGRPLMSRGLFTASQQQPSNPTTASMSRRGTGTARNNLQTGGIGVGLNTEINVENRPVTREGMFGMKTKSNQKRQVQSQSYYLGELHSKISLLNEEIERLRNEYKKLQQDKLQSEVLLKKENDIKDELKALSSRARDLNVSVEKLQQFDAINAQDKEPYEKLKHQYEKIVAENEALRNENNEIFRNRNDIEEIVREMEQKVQDLNDDLDSKLNVDLSKRKMYYSLKEEKAEQDAIANQFKTQLQELDEYLSGDGGSVLSNDPQKQKYYEKLQEKRGLEKRKNDVQNKLSGNVVGDEEKDQLMLQMKNDKQEATRIQEAMKLCKQSIATEKEMIATLQGQLDAHKGDKSKQYSELLQKEQVFSKYINNYGPEKSKELAEITEAQELIVQLLEHISINMSNHENLPTKTKLDDMKDDLEFKQEQKNISQSTLERLRLELKQKKEDLEKVNNLEVTVNQESKQLTNSIQEKRRELEELSNIENLKRRYDINKADLAEKREQLKLLKENLKTEMHLLSRQNSTLERKLKTNDIYNALNELEQKIRVYEQNNFLLNDYITQKGAESDYTSIKSDTLSILHELNEVVKSEQNFM